MSNVYTYRRKKRADEAGVKGHYCNVGHLEAEFQPNYFQGSTQQVFKIVSL